MFYQPLFDSTSDWKLLKCCKTIISWWWTLYWLRWYRFHLEPFSFSSFRYVKSLFSLCCIFIKKRIFFSLLNQKEMMITTYFHVLKIQNQNSCHLFSSPKKIQYQTVSRLSLNSLFTVAKWTGRLNRFNSTSLPSNS